MIWSKHSRVKCRPCSRRTFTAPSSYFLLYRFVSLDTRVSHASSIVVADVSWFLTTVYCGEEGAVGVSPWSIFCVCVGKRKQIDTVDLKDFVIPISILTPSECTNHNFFISCAYCIWYPVKYRISGINWVGLLQNKKSPSVEVLGDDTQDTKYFLILMSI